MAALHPYPFGALVRRLFRELERKQSIFDLPLDRAFLGLPDHDLSVRFHGRRASTPFGPAAGPQSQLAQNIVLSWLAGGRIIELKTVQQDDELTIPRPCIDMQTVGFNVEWSQELKLEQSLEEYVKASMLVEMLVASGRLPLAAGFTDVVFDMSVGYDLAGIRGERVQAFMRGMRDATPIVDRLRREIPAEYASFRDLAFSTRISDTVTLSTFHGCPPGEIERIADFLLRDLGVHTIVKLNPMLLGPAETRRLLHDALGYRDIRVPDRAFGRDTTWAQLVEFVGRLGDTAATCGLGFGLKFTNTLIVENHREFFPATERDMYLSGRPLHVLAVQLVGRFRGELGDRYPISFSAGVDRVNFPDAVALGLVPVTVCTDLLKPGGYARGRGYFVELVTRMRAVGASTVDEFILKAHGHARAALDRLTLDPPGRDRCARALGDGGDLREAAGEASYRRWVAKAALMNTEAYAAAVLSEPRYAQAGNTRVPRKIGRRLELFDCISCDKCVPVCPNDANFVFRIAPVEIPIVKVRRAGSTWRHRPEGRLVIHEPRQFGTFVDFCNDCGNCDVFCPEDGGPYLLKPRVFGSAEAWVEGRGRDGFFITRTDRGATVLGRFSGQEYRLETSGRQVAYSGDGFSLVFDEQDPLGSLRGEAAREVDMTCYHIMHVLQAALLSDADVNYVNCLPS